MNKLDFVSLIWITWKTNIFSFYFSFTNFQERNWKVT